MFYLYNRLFKNVSFNLMNEVVNKGLIFVANIVLARRLGVESFGLFVAVQSLILSLTIFTDLGTEMYSIRNIARMKESDRPRFYSEIFSLRLMLGVGVYAVIVMLSIWNRQSTHLDFISVLPDKAENLILYGGFYLLLAPTICTWIVRGQELFSTLFLGNCIAGAAYFGMIFFAIVSSADLKQALLIWSASALVTSGVIFIMLAKRGLAPKLLWCPKRWCRHLTISQSFFFAGVLSLFFQYLPIYLVAHFGGSAELGYFSANFRIISSFTAIGFFITQGFYPVLASFHHTNVPVFSLISKVLWGILFVIGFSLLMLLYFGADYIVGSLLGYEYLPGILAFKVLALILPINTLRYRYTAQLSSMNQQIFQLPAFAVGILAILLCVFFHTLAGKVELTALLMSKILVFSELLVLFVLMGVLNIARARSTHF